MTVSPFETYQHYLSLKNHFTNPKYDFFKYGAKTRASVTSFNKRKDKYWFEKTSRKYSDKEVVDFLVSNFTATDNPQNLWIGEIINSGERNYSEWMKRQQSLTYLFKEQSNELFSENELESVVQLYQGSPSDTQKVSKRERIARNLRQSSTKYSISQKTLIRSWMTQCGNP
jgi:hypothetical protein